MTGGARQMRLVVEVEDFDAAVAFFRDALGLPEEAAFSGYGDERVVILEAGRATLELANPAHHRYVDEVEVGRPVAPRFRLACLRLRTFGAAAAAIARRHARRSPLRTGGEGRAGHQEKQHDTSEAVAECHRIAPICAPFLHKKQRCCQRHLAHFAPVFPGDAISSGSGDTFPALSATGRTVDVIGCAPASGEHAGGL